MTPDEMTTDKTLCLPGSACDLIGKVGMPARHPGLQLDKLSWAGQQDRQKSAIDAVTECRGGNDFNDLLKRLSVRRDIMLKTLAARRFRGRTIGALTLHLARPHALENAGLALHPTYGFAWLPGSGLKGMTRAWAETVRQRQEGDAAASQIEAAFGTPKAAGRIVFHDAWPERWPRLRRDIVNPHHTQYYTQKKPPGDWEDPVPAFFLTVAEGTLFDFALSDRRDNGDGLLDRVVDWMRAALEQTGAGAKTAAGYGRIVPCTAAEAPETTEAAGPPVQRAETAPAQQVGHCSSLRLSLVSPAFLAGARQESGDCDLRGAGLRGLLRWWWRTMHAKHLQVADLARLEAAVWGDTERGSAVRLSLRTVETNGSAAHYDKKGVADKAKLPKSERDRPGRDRRDRTVQGLFYISYGMDEQNSTPRYYRSPGDRWDLHLTARASCWKPDGGRDGDAIELPAETVLHQARAALWLLTRFGGAGAKSRKGFGAFDDVEVKDIAGIEDCIAAAEEFRRRCGLERRKGDTPTPALDSRICPVSVETGWKNPWFALDRLGAVYRRFVQKQSDDARRAALGLPRKSLKGPRGEQRLASPALFSLARRDDDCLTVRLIAFPDPRDDGAGKKVLENLVEHVAAELPKEVKRHSTGGKTISRPPAGAPERQLVTNQRVQAELLEEKTKNGGWKAREIETGIAGNIENSREVPAERKPGDSVELIVRIANPKNAAFVWPTPKVEEQVQRLQSKNRAHRKGKGRNRR